MTRILIADDHPIIRHGIRQILSSAPDLQVAGETGCGRDLLEQARAVEHDAVVLDLSMPDTDGLDVLKQLKRERPRIPVVVLTIHSEDHYGIRSLRAGASGYLTKEAAGEELVAAVRKVAAGERYITGRIAERLVTQLSAPIDRPLHEALSDREFQVLRLLATGKSTREIAVALSLSVKTVSTYRARLLEKMRMKSIAELAAYATRHLDG
jgi:DNA-binding NarL/FixJ family response regulator